MSEIKRISFPDYAASTAINNSFLGDVRRSPLHAIYRRDNPRDTEAMARGRALHTLVLEPGEFEQAYVVAPACDRRTKEGKALWSEFEAKAAGRVVLKEEEADLVDAMARSIDMHPAASKIIKLVEATELSLFWTDEPTGIDCKARVDALAKIGNDVLAVDIKTSRDASPAEFGRSIYNFGYHRQAAFYLSGLAACGRPAIGWVMVVVESEAPHAVAAYRLPDEAIDVGRSEIRALMATVAQCRLTNEWPGYPEEIVDIALPAWAMTKAEKSLTPDQIRF